MLNTMLYVRGNKRDFNLWEALGNPGWGYEDVLPYFIKSEDQRNPYLARNTKYHGTGERRLIFKLIFAALMIMKNFNYVHDFFII